MNHGRICADSLLGEHCCSPQWIPISRYHHLNKHSHTTTCNRQHHEPAVFHPSNELTDCNCLQTEMRIAPLIVLIQMCLE